jgi:RimJ/RimL family protein N-acetyltransferase
LPIEQLDADLHGQQFAEFRCNRERKPWTELVEWSIQNQLADNLRGGYVRAIGIRSNEEIISILVWGEDDNGRVWDSIILATKTGHSQRGYAQQLKEELLRLAAEAGVEEVVSLVHRNNRPMIRLNEKLGASGEPDPTDLLGEHLVFRFETRQHTP